MSGNGKHILLIDDDTDMHDVVRLMLEPLGYQLTCVTTRAAGMQALRTRPPDLLLLDVMLSTPTEGLELARELRQDETCQHLPIIMVSVHATRCGLCRPPVPERRAQTSSWRSRWMPANCAR